MKETFHLPALLLASAYFFTCPAEAQNEGEMLRSWKYSCDKDGCQAVIGVSQNDEFVMAWTVQKDPASDKLSSTIRVPLGAVLPPGIRVFASDETYFPLQFQICLTNGCFATVLMDEKIQSQILASGVMRVAYFRQSASGPKAEGVSFDVPVGGFDQVVSKFAATP